MVLACMVDHMGGWVVPMEVGCMEIACTEGAMEVLMEDLACMVACTTVVLEGQWVVMVWVALMVIKIQIIHMGHHHLHQVFGCPFSVW